MFFVALVLAVAPAVQAVQPRPSVAGGKGWWMGLGYLDYQRPYVGADRWHRVLPVFDINTTHFYVHGMAFGWKAWRRGASSVRLVARPDALHYNASENSALAGMTTKLATLMGGAAWIWRFQRHVSLRAELLTDLLRRNDGEILTVGVAGHWHAGPWFFAPSAMLHWDSANYVDYYFGVTPAEARADRPAYSGRASLNESVGFTVGRVFAHHFSATLGAFTTHYASGITESPIVSRKETTSLLLALYYHF